MATLGSGGKVGDRIGLEYMGFGNVLALLLWFVTYICFTYILLCIITIL